MTESLKLRHRLLPYLYSMAVRASIEGTAIVEPMYYDWPDEVRAYQHKNQFRFGSQLFVSPITSPRDKSTGLGKAVTWFPPGRFVDVFTGQVYDGDRIVSLHRTLDKTPVLAPEGAIVPLDGAMTLENGCPIPKSIDVMVVVGADGHFEMVEDDGTGSDIKGIDFARTIFTFDQSSGTITIEPPSKPLVESRDWSIRLISLTPKTSITVNVHGKKIPIKSEKLENGTLVHLGSIPSSKTIMINLNVQNPQLDKKDVNVALFPLLDAAQMRQVVKQAVWKLLEKRPTLNVLLSELESMDVDPPVLEAILELLLAESR